MLYQEKALGQTGLGARLAARLALMFSRQKQADLDLLSMSPHLQRDIGLDTANNGLRADYIWRK